mmetsp:Transcript_66738/g.123302  ORF Transcript_66738/g.123302 Transcript_66738/m.123302 type:complete len:662 (+) Transcript_66738:82-2067(+)
MGIRLKWTNPWNLSVYILLVGLVPQGPLRQAHADLPIHCTMQDVAGEWTFFLGPASPMKGQIPACGHSIPNTVSAALNINRTAIVPPDTAEEFTVDLTEDIVESPRRQLRARHGTPPNMEVGMWTMVFDAGLEVRVGGRSLVAHFLFSALPNATRQPENGDNFEEIGKYLGRVDSNATMEPGGETYACHCNMVSTGWWHQKSPDGLEAGCLWAARKELIAPGGTLTQDAPVSSFVRLRRRQRHEEGKPLNGSGRQISSNQLAAGHSNGSFLLHDAKENAQGFERRDDFLVKEVFRPKRREPQRKMKDEVHQPVRRKVSLRGVRAHVPLENSTTLVLPEFFDWREVLADMVPPGEDPLGAQIDQGPCGSCYAFAGIMILQMRFRVQLFRQYGVLYPLELSYKSATRCSPYTEGCSGGFSYFTSRLATEIGVPLFSKDIDVPAGSLDTPCDWQSYKNNSMLFYAKDYWHVGGFSHGSDEQRIMREIYVSGPVELGFSTTAFPEFAMVNGDSAKKSTDVMTVILNKRPPKEIYSTNPDVQRWWYSTHAILAVGWGEEVVNWGMVKYWAVRNSWGRGWGEQGYGKMRRGNNDGAIETDASMVEPDMDRLPAGFLEQAVQYQQDHVEARARWREQREASRQGTPDAAHASGIADYCKQRPESPDCN